MRWYKLKNIQKENFIYLNWNERFLFINEIEENIKEFYDKIYERNVIIKFIEIKKFDIEFLEKIFIHYNKVCFKSKHLIKVYDYFKINEKKVAVILEKFEAISLDDLVKLAKKEKKVVSIKIIKEISLQLFKTINFLHKFKIYHFDIKLSNILLKKEKVEIVLIDFNDSYFEGIKKNTTIGTLGYIPPEILNETLDKKNLNKVDIWSSAITILKLYSNNNYLNEIENDNLKGDYFFEIKELPFLNQALQINPEKRSTAIEIVKSIK